MRHKRSHQQRRAQIESRQRTPLDRLSITKATCGHVMSDCPIMPLRLPRSQSARRDAPVLCPACHRAVPRKSRQQAFCSRKCRQRAYWNRKAIGKISSYVTHSTGRSTNPQKSANENNHLQGRKSGSSKFANAPLDLLGGSWRWPGTARLNPTKRRAIIAAEIGWVP
jgi:hypothetical protein